MMTELTLQECREIDGGVTWSTVLTGAGVACMAAAPSAAAAAAGYAAYNAGAIGTILGVCDL